MLAPWVVDELERIRRERMEREREASRPRVQNPGHTPHDRPESEREADDADREEARRGVVIIQIG